MTKKATVARSERALASVAVARVTPLASRNKKQNQPSLGQVQAAMNGVELVVAKHFPDLLDGTKAALAVVAVGCLKGNIYPTALMLSGPSSAGKTQILQFFLPDDDEDPLNAVIYRSDKFSAASFVSQASKETTGKTELGKVDLLPRIEGKTLVTKELAPMFRGHTKELIERFNVLTAVLDGLGFVSDSGIHGRRGYTKPVNFQWLGATTPLNKSVLRAMETLGPRMCFYGIAGRVDDEEALVNIAMAADEKHAAAIRECQLAVRRLIITLYKAQRPNGAAVGIVQCDSEQLRTVVKWSIVMTRLRASLPKKERSTDFMQEASNEDARDCDDEPNDRDDLETTESNPTAEEHPIKIGEHPARALRLLRRIATGSALVHGRGALNDYDLAQVAHIALSSGHPIRAGVVRCLIANGGVATTPHVQRLLRVSAPTARPTMDDVVRLGLAVVMDNGDESRPYKIALAPAFEALRDAPMLKENGGESEAR